MVSTYLQYNLVTRDMKASINRIAGDTLVARDTAYYKENIGKVKTVDEFVNDYRLFSYAMKAYGLEDMTYAKAFMKKVLESDLNDDNSYANKLTDERYRNFAMAFGFSKSTAVLQSNAQEDAVIGLYNESVANLDSVMKSDANYFDAMTTSGQNVDQFLHNDRLRNYTFTVFGINEKSYVYNDVRGAMTSDLSDSNSYFNQNWQPYITAYETLGPGLTTEANQRSTRLSLVKQINQWNIDKTAAGADTAAIQAKIDDAQTTVDSLNQSLPAYTDDATEAQTVADIQNRLATMKSYSNQAYAYKDLATFFHFNADGSAPANNASFISDENKANMREAYFANSKRVTPGAAMINKQHYETDIQTVKTVKDLITNSKLFNYMVTAYGLPASTLTTEMENVLTDDPTAPDSYIAKSGKMKDLYTQINKDFNFATDGTVKSGMTAQTATQMANTSNGYLVYYNDKDDAADEALIAAYKKALATASATDQITNVDKFLANTTVLKVALTAFGLDKADLTTRQLKQILTSDLNDPKSYANTQKDDRFIQLAKAYNFKPDGALGAPMMAQSESELLVISKNYVLRKAQFGTKEDKTKAEAEATYYSDNVAKVQSLDDLLKNSRLTNFVLEAYGLDPTKYDKAELKKIFTSDLSDPKSYINTLEETKFRDIVSSFNFNAAGQVVRPVAGQIQTRHGLMQTQDMYYNQSLEETQGEDNAGVRLALYFRRTANNIGSAYDILADTALLEVVRTAFSIPEEMQQADVDVQKAYIDKVLKVQDLHDPAKLEKFLTRFAALYDSTNNTDVSPAVTLLGSSGGSTGISADTLMTLTQLRTGGF
ncbi:hypothetical protein BJF93_17945 [Xaviernesmea oryzae]|uniref:Flagellar protein n=1 Tax=Xaviernesmea oryzae TaxID=464029 RepID=A0A1Q9ATE5_9HYPH|nr:hypothetical protein BJF93_17945 [Xaviernesmea oryzae]SEK69003.1 Protein of unknown function [Xaviernesmea oryzae]